MLGSGCISHPSAPVTDLSPQQKVTTHYTVIKGDTLHAISFRTGIDYRKLAVWNHLSDPYRIFVGDVLRLTTSSSNVSGRTITSATTSPTQGVIIKPKLASTPLPQASLPKRVAKWQWPTKGKLTQTFSKPKAQYGIQISAKKKTPIHSAAKGQVVYAGNAIKGYGELVIVKHSPTFISAYAHNDKILVKEGDQVRAGQLLANMGSTGTKGVKLHFEIRKDGEPVNPLRYLPLKSG